MRSGIHSWRSRLAASPRQAGSAYIAVLLVLVVLTIFGLVLTLITQTEMQMGSNERTVSRVFYSADSGIEAAIAQVLIAKDFEPKTYLYTDSGLQPFVANKLQFGAQVDVSRIEKVQEAPCNLCEINQSGGYGGKDYAKTTYLVTSTASRFGTFDVAAAHTPLAQKTVSAMIAVQPFEKTIVDNTCIKAGPGCP